MTLKPVSPSWLLSRSLPVNSFVLLGQETVNPTFTTSSSNAGRKSRGSIIAVASAEAVGEPVRFVGCFVFIVQYLHFTRSELDLVAFPSHQQDRPPFKTIDVDWLVACVQVTLAL